jgi:hypothetical protein
VIGKRGATAQSIRTLLRALGTKQEARYNLKIVDVDRLDENGNPLPRPEREDRPVRDDSQSVASNDSASDDTAQAASAPAASDDDDGAFDVPAEKKESDTVARTRAELADLDDLDI